MYRCTNGANGRELRQQRRLRAGSDAWRRAPPSAFHHERPVLGFAWFLTRFSLVCAAPLLVSVLWIMSVAVERVARTTSPDGRLHAVVHRVNPGALDPFSYAITLETDSIMRRFVNSEDVAYIRAVQIDPTTAGIRIEWLSNRRLLIEFQGGGVLRHQPLVQLAQRSVTVEITGGAAP